MNPDDFPEARNPAHPKDLRYSLTDKAKGPVFSPGEKVWLALAISTLILLFIALT